MCQVLSGKLGLGYHGIDFFGEPVEGASDWSSNSSERWQRGGQARSQKAIVGSGKEERNAPAEIGDAISEAVGRALNQAVEAVRDRNRSATIQTMSLTRSLIPQEHRPILDQLPVRLSLRQGQRSKLESGVFWDDRTVAAHWQFHRCGDHVCRR